jgi:hypothetical protein
MDLSDQGQFMIVWHGLMNIPSAKHQKRDGRPKTGSLFIWVVAGANLFREKSTASWLLVAGLLAGG